MQASLFKDPIFRSFATERPFATMTQMVLRQMLAPDVIDKLFDEHAEVQYHCTLFFSSLTQLVAGVVQGKYASMNACHKAMKQQLAVSITAVYGKLQRLELPVAWQLVRQSYQQTVEKRLRTNGTNGTGNFRKLRQSVSCVLAEIGPSPHRNARLTHRWRKCHSIKLDMVRSRSVEVQNSPNRDVF